MRTGAAGRHVTLGLFTLGLITLSLTACADDPGTVRSSWDVRSVGSPPAPAQSPRVAWDGEPSRAVATASVLPRSPGPLPIDRPLVIDRPPPVQTSPPPYTGRMAVPGTSMQPAVAPGVAPGAPPTMAPAGAIAAPMCPSYGNDAAAILEARMFPRESARISGSYQLSDSGTMVSFWRNTPLVVLGLQGRPVYCVADRFNGQFQVPAGRRVCFADTDGDFLFDRVYVIQAEPRNYATAPLGYRLNPIEAARRPPSVCHVSG